MTEADADADADADELAEATADALPEPDALADPLGAGVTLGVGLGLGVGKMLLGIRANDRAKISTKMTTTAITHSRARLSVRGGSAPRYPGAGASAPPAAPPRL